MLSEERIAELWEMGYVAKLTQRAFAFARAIEAAVLAEKQEPFAWVSKNDVTGEHEIEWNRNKPGYEGVWFPVFKESVVNPVSFCCDERPCIPCYTDNGPCTGDAEYKQEPVAWVGCGECDCEFPCYHGKTTCLRLPTEKQEPVKDEPVAWMWKFKGDDGAAFCTKEPTLSIKDGVDYVPLYTHPQPETKNAGYWHKCHEIAESTNVALRKQIQDLTAEVERLKEINRDLCSKSNSYIVANAQQKERIAELEAQDTEMCDVHAQLLVEHGKAKLHIAALEEAAREARDAFEQHDGNYKLSKASGAIVDAAIAKLDAVIKEVL